MRILIAEDDKISRDLLCRILESEQRHTLITVADGEAAWKRLNEPEQGRIDLLLLDVIMPRLDGLSLVEKMRAANTLKTIPIILCTASSDRPTVQRAALLSVTHYIVKPYVKNIILEKIRLVESELSAAESLEDTGVVCERLGLEPATHGEMLTELCAEVRTWILHARTGNLAHEREALLVDANGFKGSCLSLGARLLSRLLGEVEALLQSPPTDKTAALLTVSCNAIENELRLLTERLKAQRKA